MSPLREPYNKIKKGANNTIAKKLILNFQKKFVLFIFFHLDIKIDISLKQNLEKKKITLFLS